MTILRAAALLSAAAFVSGCAFGPPDPPSRQNDACAILDQQPDWGDALAETARRRGAPPEVVMAIIWKESSFQGDARTSRTYTLGFIPTGRRSSAYGYPQAIDGTWEWYQDDTGRHGADRDDFDDAADFVGWYMQRSRASNGIAMDDAFHQYLNYHEGHTGWRRGGWKRKDWLQRTARDVQRQSETYARQLAICGL